MEEVIIRKYECYDASEVEHMMLDFYNSPAVLSNIDPKNIKNTIALLNQTSPFQDAYVLVVDGKIAGYVLLAFTYSNESGCNVVWIEETYIKQQYRGKHYARKMIDQIIKEYPHPRRFRLEAVKTNQVSINLFTSFGFETFDYLQLVKDTKNQ